MAHFGRLHRHTSTLVSVEAPQFILTPLPKQTKSWKKHSREIAQMHGEEEVRNRPLHLAGTMVMNLTCRRAFAFAKFFDVVCAIWSLQWPSEGDGFVTFIEPEDTNMNWGEAYLPLPVFLKWLSGILPLAEAHRVSLGFSFDEWEQTFTGKRNASPMPTHITTVAHILTAKVQEAYGVVERGTFTVRTHFDFLALSLPQLCNFRQVLELLWAGIFSLIKRR